MSAQCKTRGAVGIRSSHTDTVRVRHSRRRMQTKSRGGPSPFVKTLRFLRKIKRVLLTWKVWRRPEERQEGQSCQQERQEAQKGLRCWPEHVETGRRRTRCVSCWHESADAEAEKKLKKMEKKAAKKAWPNAVTKGCDCCKFEKSTRRRRH